MLSRIEIIVCRNGSIFELNVIVTGGAVTLKTEYRG